MIIIKYLDVNENNNNVNFYPITHESAVIDDDGVTLEEKLSNYDTSKYYIKTTYEYNKEINLENGYVELLGKFSCSTSNITIEINSSDSDDTYHCVAILSTIGWSNDTIGAYTWKTYGDLNNTLTSKLFMKRTSNTLCELFLDDNDLKAAIHIQCVNLTAEPQNICETIASKPTDATINPTNADNNNIYNYLRQNYLMLNYGGIISGGNVSINSSGTASFNNTALAADRLAIGRNGIAMSARDTNGDGAAIFMEKSGTSENNNLVIAMGNDGTASGDDIVFRQYTSSGSIASNIYVPKKTNDTLAIYEDYYDFPSSGTDYEIVYLDYNHTNLYPNKTYFCINNIGTTISILSYDYLTVHQKDIDAGNKFFTWHIIYDSTNDAPIKLYTPSSSYYIIWDNKTDVTESTGLHYDIYLFGVPSVNNPSSWNDYINMRLYGVMMTWPISSLTYS